MAPEILNSQNKKYLYSEVCDVFSCGCIFFKLYYDHLNFSITGNNLFLAVNLDQLLRLNKKCEIDFDVDELASIDKFVLIYFIIVILIVKSHVSEGSFEKNFRL